MGQLYNIINKLPNIQNRLGVVLFVFVTFCILALSLTFFALSPGKPYMGVQLTFSDQGWTVYSVDVNGLASQEGVRAGDQLIQINSQPADMFLEQFREPGSVYFAATEQLTVIDNSGQSISLTLESSTPSWQSFIELVTWFVVSLIFWAVGFYVIVRQPRSTPALLLCLCSLAFGLALSANMAAERAIPTALWFAVAATVVGPWLLLHYFLVLPEERTKLRKSPLTYLIYIPAVITLVLFPIIGYADGQSLPGFRALRLLEFGIGFLAVVGVVFFNYLRTISPRTRQQMKIVLISALIAILPFLALNILPEVIWRQTILPTGFTILFVAFIPLGMGYAVVTQKLMDIDVIIRRGIVYGLITVVMAAVLSVAILLVVSFQESFGTPEQIIVALVLSGLATILFGPTKKGVEILVDRLLYKDRYDYRQIIQSLSTSLKSLTDFVDISRLVVGTTVQTLNLAGGCLFIKTQSNSFEVAAAQGTFIEPDKQKRLETLISDRSGRVEFLNPASDANSDVAFLIPLVAADKEIGILCLSPKASRQDFSPSDIYLLHDLASVAAMALRGAMLMRDVSMRDTFVSVASHELRTPLTSITGYAELLLRGDPPIDTRKRWLKNIHDNSQKVAAMVDDLLNVSRIRSGKVPMKPETLKLSDALKKWTDITRVSIDKHDLIVDIESSLPEVFVDRDKLGHILSNLLSNAVKYSPNGGRITVTARNDSKHHRIVISIADEGIGIGQEDRNSLFTTFHRIHRPETRGIAGSGLGLYIAKEWTEAMGGEIWFESELNKGSTFFVGFPTQYSSKTE